MSERSILRAREKGGNESVDDILVVAVAEARRQRHDCE